MIFRAFENPSVVLRLTFRSKILEEGGLCARPGVGTSADYRTSMAYLMNPIEEEPCGGLWLNGEKRPLERGAARYHHSAAPPAGTYSASTANGGLTIANDHRFRLPVSAASFLGALVLLLVATPFVQGFSEGPLYEAVLYTLVMCTGLLASGSRRRIKLAAVCLALTAIWLNQLWPQKCPALTFILPAMAFLGIVIASLLAFILRAEQVDANVLCAGISVYLILGLLWGLAYTLVAQVNLHAFECSSHPGTPVAMSGFTSMYFSFTTLATLGYGDITPATDIARMLTMLEGMTGTLFVGVMIARLVCLYSASGQIRKNTGDRGRSNHK